MNTRKVTAVLLLVVFIVSVSRAQTPHNHETAQPGSFDGLMAQAMERMHKGMTIVPSGDPDRDFAAMMIPHHQGAVEMAKVELQFGKNPVLHRLAQGIIVEQLQEMALPFP
jgi:uncharacterized protein (DUF305 family)